LAVVQDASQTLVERIKLLIAEEGLSQNHKLPAMMPVETR
jgi:hypothetical protein